jgi:hypothetical protein
MTTLDQLTLDLCAWCGPGRGALLVIFPRDDPADAHVMAVAIGPLEPDIERLALAGALARVTQCKVAGKA